MLYCAQIYNRFKLCVHSNLQSIYNIHSINQIIAASRVLVINTIAKAIESRKQWRQNKRSIVCFITSCNSSDQIEKEAKIQSILYQFLHCRSLISEPNRCRRRVIHNTADNSAGIGRQIRGVISTRRNGFWFHLTFGVVWVESWKHWQFGVCYFCRGWLTFFMMVKQIWSEQQTDGTLALGIQLVSTDLIWIYLVNKLVNELLKRR